MQVAPASSKSRSPGLAFWNIQGTAFYDAPVHMWTGAPSLAMPQSICGLRYSILQCPNPHVDWRCILRSLNHFADRGTICCDAPVHMWTGASYLRCPNPHVDWGAAFYDSHIQSTCGLSRTTKLGPLAAKVRPKEIGTAQNGFETQSWWNIPAVNANALWELWTLRATDRAQCCTQMKV